jgi:hypothetical protein
MQAIFLLILIGLSVVAIVGGKGAKWKLLNLLIIIGFMAVGLGIGWALGAWGSNMAIGAAAALPLAILLGCVGALGCYRRNGIRAKANVPPAA